MGKWPYLGNTAKKSGGRGPGSFAVFSLNAGDCIVYKKGPYRLLIPLMVEQVLRYWLAWPT